MFKTLSRSLRSKKRCRFDFQLIIHHIEGITEKSSDSSTSFSLKYERGRQKQGYTAYHPISRVKSSENEEYKIYFDHQELLFDTTIKYSKKTKKGNIDTSQLDDDFPSIFKFTHKSLKLRLCQTRPGLRKEVSLLRLKQDLVNFVKEDGSEFTKTINFPLRKYWKEHPQAQLVLTIRSRMRPSLTAGREESFSETDISSFINLDDYEEEEFDDEEEDPDDIEIIEIVEKKSSTFRKMHNQSCGMTPIRRHSLLANNKTLEIGGDFPDSPSSPEVVKYLDNMKNRSVELVQPQVCEPATEATSTEANCSLQLDFQSPIKSPSREEIEKPVFEEEDEEDKELDEIEFTSQELEGLMELGEDVEEFIMKSPEFFRIKKPEKKEEEVVVVKEEEVDESAQLEMEVDEAVGLVFDQEVIDCLEMLNSSTESVSEEEGEDMEKIDEEKKAAEDEEIDAEEEFKNEPEDDFGDQKEGERPAEEDEVELEKDLIEEVQENQKVIEELGIEAMKVLSRRKDEEEEKGAQHDEEEEGEEVEDEEFEYDEEGETAVEDSFDEREDDEEEEFQFKMYEQNSTISDSDFILLYDSDEEEEEEEEGEEGEQQHQDQHQKEEVERDEKVEEEKQGEVEEREKDENEEVEQFFQRDGFSTMEEYITRHLCKSPEKTSTATPTKTEEEEEEEKLLESIDRMVEDDDDDDDVKTPTRETNPQEEEENDVEKYKMKNIIRSRFLKKKRRVWEIDTPTYKLEHQSVVVDEGDVINEEERKLLFDDELEKEVEDTVYQFSKKEERELIRDLSQKSEVTRKKKKRVKKKKKPDNYYSYVYYFEEATGSLKSKTSASERTRRTGFGSKRHNSKSGNYPRQKNFVKKKVVSKVTQENNSDDKENLIGSRVLRRGDRLMNLNEKKKNERLMEFCSKILFVGSGSDDRWNVHLNSDPKRGSFYLNQRLINMNVENNTSSSSSIGTTTTVLGGNKKQYRVYRIKLPCEKENATKNQKMEFLESHVKTSSLLLALTNRVNENWPAQAVKRLNLRRIPYSNANTSNLLNVNAGKDFTKIVLEDLLRYGVYLLKVCCSKAVLGHTEEIDMSLVRKKPLILNGKEIEMDIMGKSTSFLSPSKNSYERKKVLKKKTPRKINSGWSFPKSKDEKWYYNHFKRVEILDCRLLKE